jgi:hypothetical protein
MLMFRSFFTGAVLFASLVAGVNGAHAGVRNFFSPSLLGDRIAFCSDINDVCGKPVADQWCVRNGFEKALRFQRDHSKIAQVASEMRSVDTGDKYTGKKALSFRHIKCYSAN